MSSATPNMDLPVPTPGSTPGPEWSQLLNDALAKIDQHAHVPGQGVSIPISALDVSANLNMLGLSVTNAAFYGMEDQITDAAAMGLYPKNGELFYRDATGNRVQITNNGSVNAASGAITGLESPAAALYTLGRFSWTYDASKYATMGHADLALYPFDGVWDPVTETWSGTAFTKSVTLKAPTALEAAASYALTFPTALPASGAEYLSVDATGAINHATLSGTTNQVAVSANATAITLSLPATVSTTTFSAGVGAVGTPSHTFTGRTTTGMYSPGADQVALAAGGTQRLLANSTGVAVTGALSSSTTTSAGTVFLGSNGSLSAPTYSFTSDTNTGIYHHPLADTAALVAGGSSILGWDASTIYMSAPVAYNGSGGSAVAHKTSIFTGSIPPGDDVEYNIGATIYAAYGWAQDTYGGYTSIASADQPPGNVYFYSALGTSTRVNLTNSGGNAASYRVVIIHA